MTTPAPSGSTSRRRIAGLALVGVGVIAAIIGLGTLTLGGGNGGGTAAPLTGTAAPTAGAEPGAGSPTPAPPTASGPITVPTFPTTTANVAAPPATEAPAPADQGGGGAADAGTGAPKGPIRVYNNSTITGLASNAATDFKSAGWDVGEVANYPFGIIPTTTVYYRPGTDEQSIAEELGREFGIRVNPRFEGLKDATPGVIVIVTNDFPSKSK